MHKTSQQSNQESKKRKKTQIDIPDIGNLEHLKIVVYSDASFANLTDGISQEGNVLFFGRE